MSGEIIVEKRSGDWMAYLKGHREIWECGASAEEAVEKMRVRLSKM